MLFYFFLRYPTATLNDSKHLNYINKLKIGKYPTSPTSHEDVIHQFEDMDVKHMYGKYYKHTQNERDFAFTIFYSQKMIDRMKRISDSREILIDATFRVVPKGPYKQLLIFYMAYKNNV